MALKPTLVFTPHFAGDASSVRRHQEFFQQQGYDTTFVPYEFGNPKSALSTIRHMQSGFFNLWLAQLTEALDKISGPKIICSFSFPSCVVLRLMAEAPRNDVTGWISDGGPFLWSWMGINNFFRYTRPDLKGLPLKTATLLGFLSLGGPLYEIQLSRWIQKMPSDFPILSIRAGRDVLVPEDSIEAVFSQRQDLNIEILRLPEAEHLLGLKNFSTEYSNAVLNFLCDGHALK